MAADRKVEPLRMETKPRKFYVVQDYCGGMMIRYDGGKKRHVALERQRRYPRSVLVEASSRDEAWERAEPKLLARSTTQGTDNA